MSHRSVQVQSAKIDPIRFALLHGKADSEVLAEGWAGFFLLREKCTAKSPQMKENPFRMLGANILDNAEDVHLCLMCPTHVVSRLLVGLIFLSDSLSSY